MKFYNFLISKILDSVRDRIRIRIETNADPQKMLDGRCSNYMLSLTSCLMLQMHIYPWRRSLRSRNRWCTSVTRLLGNTRHCLSINVTTTSWVVFNFFWIEMWMSYRFLLLAPAFSMKNLNSLFFHLDFLWFIFNFPITFWLSVILGNPCYLGAVLWIRILKGSVDLNPQKKGLCRPVKEKRMT